MDGTRVTATAHTAISAVDAWASWQDGDIDDEAALRAMLGALDAAERDSSTAEGKRALWRTRITEVVQHGNGRARLAGYGELRMGEPYAVPSYDTKVLDEIVRQMIAEGDTHNAARLQNARRVAERPATLRIMRESKRRQ